ncbi:uncharacterized protein LOC115426210 [Sphaeramia orbicularis]|uniref:uncharacterized protein LOC115426210 n=1 Tax=Sphaeramia orbicularis TaxID=375764 RepID=UPI00117D7AD9|nr:uncharacterized protein LOC115426210 [Sphaeramia orbicularis]
MGSTEKNRECAHPETEACSRHLVSNPLPTEHVEKESTVQNPRQVQHKSLRGQGRPAHFQEKKKEKKTEAKEEGETANKDEGDGASNVSAFALASSGVANDGAENVRSSVRTLLRDEIEGFRTRGQRELRKEQCKRRESTEVIFTTLHLLPKSRGEQCRPGTSSLPRLITGHQAQSRVSAEAQQNRVTQLSDLVQKSGNDTSVLCSPRLRPKPKPPGRCPGPGVQTVASCHHSGIYSPSSSSSVSPGQQAQTSSLRHPREQVKAPFSPTLSSSVQFKYCPSHRKVASAPSTFQKNL